MTFFKKIKRFIEIDMNYLHVDLPFGLKIKNILSTNYSIFVNLLLSRNKDFVKTRFNSVELFYDTPYATKTFLTGVYDFFVETNSLAIFSKNPTIIDVGANIGQYLISAKSFFPKAKIYSVEPDTKVFNILKKNVRTLTNVSLYNYALSNQNKEIDFYISNEFSEWSSLVRNANSKKIKVQTNKGDLLFSKLKDIDLIKIDVEGAELNVVKGMLKTIKKAQYLLIELSLLRSSDDLGSAKLLNLLLENGYYIYSVGRIFSEGIGKKQSAVDVLFKNKNFKR